MAARGGAGEGGRAKEEPQKPLGEGEGLIQRSGYGERVLRICGAHRPRKGLPRASLAFAFRVEIHSIPHSNSALITDENMSHGVC